MKRPGRLAMAAPMMATVMAASGCGGIMESPYNHSDAEIDRAAELMCDLPALEETEATMVAVIEEIKDVASGISPALQWEEARPRRAEGCGGAFASTDGSSVRMPLWGSQAPIPDADWPAILDAVRGIAARAGLADVTVRVDRPGDHDVVLAGGNGNRIQIGSKVAASITGETGCRYKAERMPGANGDRIR
ncbi:LppA family lipoprotein [Lolliginicoccus suaedae]|uniref:LppA family lipoprotein n=1 Tax=Lolliginicoccus suaedae TaxID=2605429 RepID=UPI0011EF1A64|nr:LppA family lipoprotein [Lolliginicoccus suaedae]